MIHRSFGAAIATLPLLAPAVHAQTPVSAAVVIKQGDLVGGSAVTGLNTPFTDGNGRMAVMALIGTGRAIVDENMSVLFNSTTVVSPLLTGAEGTIGFGNNNSYIYSPSIDGEDGVFVNGVALMRGTDPATGFPGRFITFCSRPTMTAAGVAYWVSGTSATSGGASSARVLYANPGPMNPGPPSPLGTTPLLATGDVYGGLTVGASGIGFDYSVSDNSQHRIHSLIASGVPTTSDSYVAADDVLVAREGSPAPVGNWTATLRCTSINNSGQWVFAADTTNTTTADEILLASNGQFILEGQVIDGVTLSSTCNAASINNLGDVVFTWGSGATEALFRTNISAMQGSAVKLLQVGDQIDTNGDLVGDFTIIDFEASAAIGPGLDLGDDGRVFVEVTIRPVGGTSADDVEAIVRLPGGGGVVACNAADIATAGNPDPNAGPDGFLTGDDFDLFINAFFNELQRPDNSLIADLVDGDGNPPPDGFLTGSDFDYFLGKFFEGC